jgi:hypothetical protein
VRRSNAAVGQRGRWGLSDIEVKRALCIGAASRELLLVTQLDQAIGDRQSLAIEHLSFDPAGIAGPSGDGVRVAGEWKRETKEGTDCL